MIVFPFAKSIHYMVSCYEYIEITYLFICQGLLFMFCHHYIYLLVQSPWNWLSTVEFHLICIGLSVGFMLFTLSSFMFSILLWILLKSIQKSQIPTSYEGVAPLKNKGRLQVDSDRLQSLQLLTQFSLFIGKIGSVSQVTS